jgi:NADPH:quinone reductase-like Zn-dependent oxidoreductase
MMNATTLPATMTSWQQHAYGGPDAVSGETVPVPEPAAGEVLLRVRATALNSADIRLMRGEPYLVRMIFGIRRPKHPGRGMDVAGTVIATGPGVEGFTVGDEVVGELPGGGGLAPYVIAPVKRLVRRPEAVDAVDAATLPIAAGTAWQALEKMADGARVLILGASGGVGTFAVQLATIRGARVTASCGARNRALLETLGAERTLDYTTLDLDVLAAAEPAAYDYVVVIAGPTPVRVLRRLVAPGGRIVFVSGDGGRVLGPIGLMFRCIPVPRTSVLTAVAKTDVLERLLGLTASGALRPSIEKTYPQSRAREALAHLDSLHAVGKTVVLPD